jgi:hypothetical protein
MILGALGAYRALQEFLDLTSSRDRFVARHKDAFVFRDEMPPLDVDGGMPDAGVAAPVVKSAPANDAGTAIPKQMAGDRLAEARYARRGVLLPLAAVNMILSLLLFAGCTRVLRGQAWGLSAWLLCAMVSIPYHLLDCTVSVVQARELAAVLEGLHDNEAALALNIIDLSMMWTLLKSGLEILYFAVCLLYLRRQSIRSLLE